MIQLLRQHLTRGEEFVNGRIKKTNRDWARSHDHEDFAEIVLLHFLQAFKCGGTNFCGGCQDHFKDDRQAIHRVKHAFRSTQSDTFHSITQCLRRCFGCVGPCHHPECRDLVRPCENGWKFLRTLRLHCCDDAGIHIPGGAVDGNVVAFVNGLLSDLCSAEIHVDMNTFSPCHTRFAYTSCDNSRVRCLSSATGKHPLRCEESMNVFRLGFFSDQDHLLSCASQQLGTVGVEDDVS